MQTDVHPRLRTDRHVMGALVACAGLAMILWAQFGGELIPVRDGTGFDGNTYAGLVRNPDGWVFSGRLGVHRLQRILPSLLIHAVLRPFGLHAYNPAIIWGFHLVNLALLVGSAYMWAGIARRLTLGRAATWIGFVGLFVTYATLKFPGYYPVLTDVSGFALGIALLWCVLAGRSWLILGVGLLGAWTWPIVWYSAILLFGLSRPAAVGEPARRRGAIVAALAAGLVVVASLYAWSCECASAMLVEVAIPEVVPVSLVFLAGWVFLAARPMVERLDPRRLLSAIHWPRLVLAIVLYVVVSQAQALYAMPQGHTLGRTLSTISFGGIVKPAGFLVAHTLYFGPMVILAVFLWRRIVDAVSEHGPVMVLLMFGYVLLAIGSESRQFMSMWPFVVAFAAVAVDRIDHVRVVSFAALALLVSRFWLPLQLGHVNDRPGALYVMSMGWRLNPTRYLIMLAAVSLVALGVWRIYRHARRPATSNSAHRLTR